MCFSLFSIVYQSQVLYQPLRHFQTFHWLFHLQIFRNYFFDCHKNPSFRVSCYQIVLSAQDVFYRALPCLILNQYNNKIPKAINTITNYRKPISATYTRTKTRHKHRGICCLLSLVKTCLIHYSIILNLTTVNVPRIENIIFFNLQKKTVAFRCIRYLVVPQTGNQSCVHIHPLLIQY